MPIISKPDAGDTPWTTAGDGLIDQANYIPASYVEVSTDGGGSTSQTVSNASWTTIILDTEASDANSLFNNSTYIYTVPSTGIYFCQALVRPVDSQFAKATWPDGSGMGIGVHTSNIDGPWFQWNKIMWMSGAGGGRLAMDYTRIATFTVSDQLRLYCFQDSGGNVTLTRMALTIFRIA